MYYRASPPPEIVERVRDAIRVPIDVKFKTAALDNFRELRMPLVDQIDRKFRPTKDEDVERFVSNILKRPHLCDFSMDVRDAISARYREMMDLFSDNIQYMGYSIAIFRKEMPDLDEELFLGEDLGSDD